MSLGFGYRARNIQVSIVSLVFGYRARYIQVSIVSLGFGYRTRYVQVSIVSLGLVTEPAGLQIFSRLVGRSDQWSKKWWVIF